MPVQQHVLNWLYSVLTSEYHDVNRTYNDVAQALSHYPTLSPRTDVHTFDNGVSALLLHLSGTIPVSFRGTTYRFPISLWVPHAYPREAPIVYVTPTETMLVRPGQHVDPQGQVYHPYLVGWATFWDKSTILDFLAILREVFAKEPPVVARQQQQSQSPPSRQEQGPPPVPPLPHDLTRPSPTVTPQASQDQSRPPPPPPKPTAEPTPAPAAAQPAISPQSAGGPPPLPPAPHRSASQYTPVSPQAGVMAPQRSRYDAPPPLPGQPTAGPPGPQRAVFANPQLPQAQHRYAQPPPPPAEDPRRMSAIPPPQSYAQGPPPPGWQPAPGQIPQQLQQHPPPQPKPKAPPPPDLMDQPLMLSIPSPASQLPAPPIPPNPEKDQLLHRLAQTLYALRQRSRGNNESSMAGLQAQRLAMRNALGVMQSEQASLGQLSSLLSSNANIIREALRRADSVIEGSHRHPAPDIDELLVAPTVVANQLYSLVAEERAIGDAIFVLGRAVEKGRVSPQVFAKTTRSLAREWYLKKALVRKIGRGMGLASS